MRIIKLLLLFVMLSFSAKAGELKIAATVGEEAITTYDLVSRAKLIIYSAGLQPDRETFNKVAPQALQGLINDKITMQDAAAQNIFVTPEELADAKKSIEEKNQLQPGELAKNLEKIGIPEDTLITQIKAQILQSKIKGIKLRPLINVSDDEVEDFVKAQSFNEEIEEYLLNEIVLPVEAPEDDVKTLELANKLYSELKVGGDFKAMARQFSGSGSAFNDGVVGWMPESQIPKEILAEIKKNEIGEVSAPIRSIEGYFIVKATDKRKQNSLALEDEINLKHYELPLPEKADAKKTKELLQRLVDLKYEDDACNNPENFAMKNALGSKDYGQVKIGELDAKVMPLVADLPIGVFSKPVKTAKAALTFLVCERTENLVPLINDDKRDQAREALFMRKMDLQFRKYMRDLRRKTNIEIRL